MNITLQQLEEWDACSGGRAAFAEKFASGTATYAELYAACIESDQLGYLDWVNNRIYDHGLATREFVADQVEAVRTCTMPESDDAQIGSSGWRAQIGSSGDDAQIGSSGWRAQIGSSGDDARIGSSGNGAQIGSSGDGARIGSSGWRAQIGSSGDDAQIGSSGDDARIATVGCCVRITASGKDAVVAVASRCHEFVQLAAGGCCAVAYRDAEGRTRFAVGYVGEGLEAGVRYAVNKSGEFYEVSAGE